MRTSYPHLLHPHQDATIRSCIEKALQRIMDETVDEIPAMFCIVSAFEGPSTRELHHSPMICGNRNAGKRVATVTIAVLLIMILITAVVAFRKRTAPATEPPLVPQMIVVTKEQPSSLPPLLADFGAPPRS